ncbi:MAG: 2-phospho-L-lactate transferase [Chloroflexota bacterium]
MITVLSGGTGGAKLVEGLAAIVDPSDLVIICNTGDDCVFHGLYISPDIDTMIYTLAGMSDTEKGWGIKGDSFAVLEQLRRLGNDAWFNLGDKDLATHITRTRLLNEGRTLSEISDEIRRALGVAAKILPMSDERVETRIKTASGELSFQEFFVKKRWAPEVLGVRFIGAERSRSAPGVLDAIERADAIIICPSNPITSIGPILAVPGIRSVLERADAPVVAVSPIIGAAAISGPAHKLMRASGWQASALGVARFYEGFLDKLLIAQEDVGIAKEIEDRGIKTICTNIRMASSADKQRLARELLASVQK